MKDFSENIKRCLVDKLSQIAVLSEEVQSAYIKAGIEAGLMHNKELMHCLTQLESLKMEIEERINGLSKITN